MCVRLSKCVGRETNVCVCNGVESWVEECWWFGSQNGVVCRECGVEVGNWCVNVWFNGECCELHGRVLACERCALVCVSENVFDLKVCNLG